MNLMMANQNSQMARNNWDQFCVTEKLLKTVEASAVLQEHPLWYQDFDTFPIYERNFFTFE